MVDWSGYRGRLLPLAEAAAISDEDFPYSLQVSETHRLFAPGPDALEPSDHINHSCDPNIGYGGQLVLVAMRRIEAGEEITFDYALSEVYAYAMTCRCGAPGCRGRVTGDDWRLPELIRRHHGPDRSFFAPHVRRMLAAR